MVTMVVETGRATSGQALGKDAGTATTLGGEEDPTEDGAKAKMMTMTILMTNYN